jgi:hypothetical protein
VQRRIEHIGQNHYLQPVVLAQQVLVPRHHSLLLRLSYLLLQLIDLLRLTSLIIPLLLELGLLQMHRISRSTI